MALYHELSILASFTDFEFFHKLGTKFFTRISIDFVAIIVLVRYIYFPAYKNRESFFTLFIFNLIIFLISFILNKSDMSMGAAFGLFAVFSMLRYRTEGITSKEMTYLFLSIAMGLITALSKGTWFEIAFVDFVILLITFLLESTIIFKKEVSQSVQYENIELIKPVFRKELHADLEERMGININRIEITKIDFLRDTAIIRVYYYESK